MFDKSKLWGALAPPAFPSLTPLHFPIKFKSSIEKFEKCRHLKYVITSVDEKACEGQKRSLKFSNGLSKHTYAIHQNLCN